MWDALLNQNPWHGDHPLLPLSLDVPEGQAEKLWGIQSYHSPGLALRKPPPDLPPLHPPAEVSWAVIISGHTFSFLIASSQGVCIASRCISTGLTSLLMGVTSSWGQQRSAEQQQCQVPVSPLALDPGW